MTDRFWITQEHRLMLTAALCKGETALTAWRAWRDSTDYEALDDAALRLVALLQTNMTRLGVEDPLLDRMKGVWRLSWFRNQQLRHHVLAILPKLGAAGIKVMLLKGLHLSFHYYESTALRPMVDFDLMVQRGDWQQTLTILTEAGWLPEAKIDDPFISGSSAVVLRRDGWELDLHYSPFHECLDPDQIAPLWQAATPVDFGGFPCLGLCPADLLLHCFAHGVRSNAVGPARCLADAAMVLRATPIVDWDRLVLMTQRLELRLPVRAALEILTDLVPDRIPAWVLQRLAEGPPSLLERFEWYGRSKSHLPIPFYRLGALIRLTRGLPLHRRLYRFGTALRHFLQTRGNADTAWMVVRKGAKALLHLTFPHA